MVDNPLETLTLDELRTRTSMKWRQYPPDVLPLWVAEMDVVPAQPVVDALADTLHRGDTGYAVADAYVTALDGFARRRWDWDGVRPERTAIVADVMAGIVEVLKLLTGPGDSVVVNSPVYPPFFSFVEHSGRPVVEAPLDDDLRIDLDALDRAFTTARTGGRNVAYLLCNPHNPGGTVHTPDELAAVATLATRHGVRVVADEIHAPLVLAGATFTPYLSVPGGETAFALHSASKAWNLPGLKAALIVAGADAEDDIARVPEEVSHGPSHLGVLSHSVALTEGGPWLDALLAGLAANRDLLRRLVAERLPQVRLAPLQASFLAWLDCRAVPGVPPEDDSGRGNVRSLTGPAALFLERGRVALNAGTPFGTGGAGRARINIATSAAVLTEAIDRMAVAIDQ